MPHIATRSRDYENLIGNVVDLRSPLTRELTITSFDSILGDRYDQETLAMHELARKIEQTNARSKKRLPLVKLGVFDGPRCDANLIEITGIEGDYDGGAMGLRQAERRLRDARVTALIHSSPSHDPAAPRWRVLCPISRPLAPERRHKLVARLNGVLGGVLDSSSFTRSQAFFIGSVEGDLPPTVILVDGRPIDLCSDLDEGAVGPDERADVSREPAEPMGLKLSQAARMLDELTDMRDRYEDWRNVLMAIHQEFDGSEAAWEVVDEWSRDGESYDRRNNRKLWNRLDADRPGGITMRSLNSELLRRGSDAAVVHDIADEFDDLDDEPARDPLINFLSPDDCEELPISEPVIKGLISAGDVVGIVGSPGVGKSVLAPYLAYAVAQGRNVFGHRVRQGRAFYVACEDERGMALRTRALRREFGGESNFTLVTGKTSLRKNSPFLKALLKSVRDKRPSLIVIDTVSAGFSGIEENSSQGMGEVLDVAKQLAQWGAAVVLVHHDTKAGDGRGRGYSSFFGDLCTTIHVTREEAGVIVGKTLKNKNGPSHTVVCSYINEPVTLARDSDGDAITTVLCREHGHVPHVSRPMPKGREVGALDVLRDLKGATDWVSRQAWRDEWISRQPNGLANTLRKTFGRAVKNLLEKGWLSKRGDEFLLRNSFDAIDAEFDAMEADSE